MLALSESRLNNRPVEVSEYSFLAHEKNSEKALKICCIYYIAESRKESGYSFLNRTRKYFTFLNKYKHPRQKQFLGRTDIISRFSQSKFHFKI